MIVEWRRVERRERRSRYLICFKDLFGLNSSIHSQQLVMMQSSIQTDPETHPERRRRRWRRGS